MEYLKIAFAVLGSLGSGGMIVLGLSSWLGKIWASRILEADRARYAREVADFKRTMDLELKDFEIKTSTIQAEINRMLLELSPLLSELWNACYIFIELGKIHQQFERPFMKVLAEKWKEASSKSYPGIMRAQLFLPRMLFRQVRQFEKDCHAIVEEGCKLYGYDYLLLEDKGKPPDYADTKADSLLGRATELEEDMEQILERFRKILGTTQRCQMKESALCVTDRAPGDHAS